MIERAPARLAGERFDLVVVGGGIYGVLLAAEAAAAGRRPLLLERDDFGGATSHNSLRIVHGGLRYLQAFDLGRFRASQRAQRWFLESFPDFVEPLPCLMPLYDRGLHRRSLFGLALAGRRVLSGPGAPPLPPGRVLDAEATRARFPAVTAAGLRGGGLWYDASVPSAPRLLIELVHGLCARGGAALNYVEAEGLLRAGGDGAVEGVRARDRVAGESLAFRAPVVVNAAGPWSRALSARLGCEEPRLFTPSLAWNALFARPAPSEWALALRGPARSDPTFFAVPWKGALLVGTGHAPWRDGPDAPRLSEAGLADFVAAVNAAAPGLALRPDEVLRVFTGLLPAAAPGSAQLATRCAFVDHGRAGGPRGLYSLSGVKLTEAHEVAERVLSAIFGDRRGARAPLLAAGGTRPPDWPVLERLAVADPRWRAGLADAAAHESVVHVDDLLLRRSSLGDHPGRARELAPAACALLGFDAARTQRECARLERALGAPLDAVALASAGAQ